MRGAAKAGLALALVLAAQAARADDWIDDVFANSRYVVGASLHNHPEYTGSDRRRTSIVPVLAYEYGRIRLSASGASSILDFGRDTRGPGLTASLIDGTKVKLGFGLRLDSGRKSSDSIDLAGVEDVRRTLRGRAYASYDIGDRWSLAGTVSQDLLGRRGGALASTDVGYRLPLARDTVATFGVGANWADAQHMRSYYGVSEAASARSGLPVFRPDAGLVDLHAGAGLTTAFTPRWIGFASVGATRLRSEALESPLTRNGSSVSVSIGLAYRCCKL
jgi:outer membrane scaffolding protein for murein synthesis (MipA/OmpV family)